MKVIGLDLSLTSTGVAIATEHGAVTDRIPSTGRQGATTAESAERLRRLVERIVVHQIVGHVDLVVIEAPAYGHANHGTHLGAGLWWLIADAIQRRGVPIATAAPSQVKKYATGRGNAGKDEVLAAVIRRYPHVDVNGNDEADALILAAMGARHLGHPLEWSAGTTQQPLPAAHLDAMTKVAWPDTTGDPS